MIVGPVFFVAFKLLFERKRQTLVSVIGVAIGVAAFVVMSSLLLGFQKHFIRQVIDLDAHVSVKPKLNYDEERILSKVFGPEVILDVLGSKPKEARDRIGDYGRIISYYEGKLGIVGIAPHLRSGAIIRYGPREETVDLIGIDPSLERKATSIERYLEFGELERLGTRGIILGKLVARDLGINAVGEKVVLVVENGVSRVFEVIDFFNSGITTIDNRRAYIHIRTLQKLLGRHREVNELIIKLSDVEEAIGVAKTLESLTGYEVQSWQEAYRNFLQLFKVQKYITYLVVGAVLIVSAFGIFNILMMTVLEKRRDIAILKAMGYSAEDIMWIFIFQGALIGVAGILAGSVMAYLIQEYLSRVDIELEGILRAKGFILDRSPLYYAGGSTFALLLTLFASLYPARKAARLNPVDIFRSGGA